MDTLAAGSVDPAELKKLDEVVEELPENSALARSILLVTESVRSGTDVVIAAGEERVSPAVAASLLRMSRAHLYKLMDAGELAFVRVGRDRRISLSDLAVFDRERQGARRDLAQRFAGRDAARERTMRELAAELSSTRE